MCRLGKRGAAGAGFTAGVCYGLVPGHIGSQSDRHVLVSHKSPIYFGLLDLVYWNCAFKGQPFAVYGRAGPPRRPPGTMDKIISDRLAQRRLSGVCRRPLRIWLVSGNKAISGADAR